VSGARLFQLTKVFNLDFHGTTFTVPKLSLFNLFEHQRDLFDAASYEVQSSVPLGIFEVFARSPETGTKVAVTKENAGAILLLAKEFWLEDLLSECSALQIASVPELITALSERITKLEHQMSYPQLSIIGELETEKWENQNETLVARIACVERKISDSPSPFTSRLSICEGRLEQMKSEWENPNEILVARIASVERKILDSLSVCETSIVTHQAEVNDVRTSVEELRTQLRRRHRHSTPSSEAGTVLPVSPSKLLKAADCLQKRARSFTDGIISCLTQKHGGNVHDKGIVSITSKSVFYDDPKYAGRNVADLTSDLDRNVADFTGSIFQSGHEPGQWICWDFHEMRVSLTYYTIKSV
jgi:hypothetical protein